MQTKSISEIQKLVVPICKKYHIPKLYLFGSHATGKADINSDIDFAIDSSNLRGLLELLKVKQDLEDTCNVPVDLLTLRAIQTEEKNPLKKDFIQTFYRERVCLYEQ